MTSPLSPNNGSPGEPRPTLSRQHSSGNLPNVDTALRPKSPGIDRLLSASSPDIAQPPLRPLPQRLKSSESPRKGGYEHSSSVGARSSSPAPFAGNVDEPRQIITGSFAPRVSVYASLDTEEFVQGKGFTGGFRELLQPFGEHIPGKVVARDSIGASKAWEDFSIRIVGPDDGQPFRSSSSEIGRSVNGRTSGPRDSTSSAGNSTSPFEKLIDHHLRNEETGAETGSNGFLDSDNRAQKPPQATSTVYPIYLRKLLSSMLMVPYETFCHPVACIIAVSSHNPSPIETLRHLYNQSGIRIPTFVGPEYLRYYVLIHDEEQDDITKSTALFDLMKRHFGLHCHLLRLRSCHCVQSDDDSREVPPSSWLPAENDLAQISIIDYDTDGSSHYIFDSDASALRSFLREMVTQSIVPFMENRIMTWNDQVASRRRGLSGRFMSLSKRWTAFGSSRNSSPNSSSPSTNTNYDPHLGIYPPSTPEATMRTLADYAFMLRDFRLAYSTYDFLRSDFAHDKAWAYHAAANEMAALSYLLIPQTASTRSRSETVDQMLETATYSYLTRCSLPFGAISTLTLALELLKSRGPTAAEDAARWGGKLLELGVLTPIAQAFMAERMAECYRSRAAGRGLLSLGARRRQTAFWSLLAAESWIRTEKPLQARRQLAQARRLYGSLTETETERKNTHLPSASMQPFWTSLEKALDQARPKSQSKNQSEELGRDSLALAVGDHHRDQIYSTSRNASTTQVESETMNEVSVPPLSPTAMGLRSDPLGVGFGQGGEGQRRDDGFE